MGRRDSVVPPKLPPFGDRSQVLYGEPPRGFRRALGNGKKKHGQRLAPTVASLGPKIFPVSFIAPVLFYLYYIPPRRKLQEFCEIFLRRK